MFKIYFEEREFTHIFFRNPVRLKENPLAHLPDLKKKRVSTEKSREEDFHLAQVSSSAFFLTR